MTKLTKPKQIPENEHGLAVLLELCLTVTIFFLVFPTKVTADCDLSISRTKQLQSENTF